MKCIVSIFIVVLLTSCSSDLYKNQSVGGALGTSYSLIYITEKQVDYQSEIDSVFTVINQSLSTYLPDSDISKINQGDSSIVVDAMFRDVFKLSKEIYTKSDGYFDPTVGVLVDAWGFGPGVSIELDTLQIDSLLNYVGFDKVSLTDDNTVSKSNPKVRFDFNAIAKGYAIDRLGVLLDQKGVDHYLLEVGGEIVAKGTNKLKEKDWVVGIDDPQMQETRKMKLALRLQNRALASSGNYRKFRIDSVTGKRYVHTIDPKTGFTKNTNTLGVTVLAQTCAKADGYATAFMAMNLEAALKLLTAQRELDAYIIYLNEKGETQEFMTDNFKSLIVNVK